MIALLPETSLIVPAFSARVSALISSPSVSVSSAATVYVNTSVFVPEPDE